MTVLAEDSIECLFVASLNVELLPPVNVQFLNIVRRDKLRDILVRCYVFRSVATGLILNERQVGVC